MQEDLATDDVMLLDTWDQVSAGGRGEGQEVGDQQHLAEEEVPGVARKVLELSLPSESLLSRSGSAPNTFPFSLQQ